MLYTFPDYYKEFTCTADQCEDTCCAGWEIVIDQKSLKKYKKAVRKAPKTMRLRMAASVKWHSGVFRRKDNRRCAFLSDANLCDLYSSLGSDYLCRTCRLYPRHIEEFEGVREVTLSLSCPEAARILMNREESVRFLEFEKPGEEEYKDYDPFLYSLLADARKVMIQMAQNRELRLNEQMTLILGLAHDLQIRINRRQMFSCEEVLERYRTERAVTYVRELCRKKETDEGSGRKDYEYIRRVYRKLYTLELLREDWNALLYETDRILFDAGCSEYMQMKKEFAAWSEQNMPQWKIQSEQLLVYFLSTYFCGAVYDGHIYAKVQMAVASVLLIQEFLMARWAKNERLLTTEDVIEIVYRYSREIEHSDKNLETMERFCVSARKTDKSAVYCHKKKGSR